MCGQLKSERLKEEFADSRNGSVEERCLTLMEDETSFIDGG